MGHSRKFESHCLGREMLNGLPQQRRGLASPQMTFAVHFLLLASVARRPLGRLHSSSPRPMCSPSAEYVGLWFIQRITEQSSDRHCTGSFTHLSSCNLPHLAWKWLSKCGPPGSLLEMQILRPPPDLLNQKLWGSATCVLQRPPGDSDVI